MAGLTEPAVEVAAFDDLDTTTLLAILRLRVDVFVVEQACPYPEIDGGDDQPGTRHLFVRDADGGVAAYLRLLDEGAQRRIGRVATAPAARGRGLAARLVRRAVEVSDGPWVLDAQSHLSQWYAGHGFDVVGEEFVEDGIPHVPMRRDTDHPS